MYYNYYQTSDYEFDECVSRGVCSINPTLASLQEVVLLYLREISYYLLKLSNLGAENALIKQDMIVALTGMTCNANYTQEEFEAVLTNLHRDLMDAKHVYLKLCKEKGLEPKMLKTDYKHTKKFDLSKTIAKGEKYILKRNAALTKEQKNLSDIIVFLVKSLCVKFREFMNYGKEYPTACHETFSVLNTLNFLDRDVEDIKKELESYTHFYYQLAKDVYEAQVKKYGEPQVVDVSFSTRPGKAILVATTSLHDLEMVLEATKNKGIDVYTHGTDLLVSHTFPKLRAYRHLIGHFGSVTDNALIDFATFPGAILMTKQSLQKVEYLYRGRLFTTDIVAPKGAVKIQNNDFSPLLKSASEARGFKTGHKKPPIKVGYDEKEVMKKINNVLDRYDSGEYKHLYLFGLINYVDEYADYFKKLIDTLPKDSFIFSLSYPIKGENVFHIDSFYEYDFIYKFLRALEARRPLKDYSLSTFITKCDKYTLPNILELQYFDLKNIFLCKCSPTIFNPALIDAVKNVFKIKEFAVLKDDIKEILEIKGGE